MSETTPPTPPPAPEPTPNTPPIPPTTGYTAAPQANPYATAGTPAKAPILSILSLIAGIIGFLGSWIVFIPIVGSILGLFIPAGAVVLGVLGKKKEPQAAKGLWLTGIILGAIALAIAVVALILWIVLFAAGNMNDYNTW